MEIRNCEVCGEPAEYGVRDLKRFDNMMTGWVECSPDGASHYFCGLHKRESRETFGGTIYTEEELKRVREMK